VRFTYNAKETAVYAAAQDTDDDEKFILDAARGAV
jgi:hypothetical protein